LLKPKSKTESVAYDLISAECEVTLNSGLEPKFSVTPDQA